jgi:ABC-type multidrug transport system fused ATPase/permease subunit
VVRARVGNGHTHVGALASHSGMHGVPGSSGATVEPVSTTFRTRGPLEKSERAVDCSVPATESRNHAGCASSRRSGTRAATGAWPRRLSLLGRFARPHRRALVGALGLLVLSALLKLPVPFITIYLIDTVIPARDLRALFWVSAAIVLMTVVFLIVEGVRGLVVLVVSRKVNARAETLLLSRVQQLPMSYLNAKDSGYVLARFVNDLGSLNQLATDTLLGSVQQVAVLLVGLVAVFHIHTRLAVASLAILPVFALLNASYGRRLRRQAQRSAEARALTLEALHEALSGILVTKVFSRERWELMRVFRRRADTIRTEVQNYLESSVASFLVALLGAAGPLIVLCYGGYEIVNGRLTMGALIGFSSVVAYLHGPTQALTSLYLGGQSAIASLDRVAELLEMEPEAGGCQIAGRSRLPAPRGGGAIEFRSVRLRYGTQSRPVLDGVDLSIEAGSVVAIIGESGAGKSSLVSLLFRLYEPQDGQVLIDGVDVRQLDLASLRETMGLVSQETTLCSGSIIDNIRFGKPRAQVSAVVAAARLAFAHDFIEALPRGYDTQVGRNGFQLSAGQRQRVALARTILKRPRVLILDEATSSIDSQSEELIWRALASFAAGRTTIVISHRLSSILQADTVIHLHHGRVLGAGTHAELLKGDEYRSLYGRQISSAISGVR